MIPKVINYCWFGGKKKPKSVKESIDSWRKFFPTYKIVEWNEHNFDVNSNKYIKKAYDEKKWAFVSDYVRFKVLYENGGLYFDTDVQIIKSFDELLSNGPFLGVEYAYGKASIGAGLGMAAEGKMDIYKEVLDFYENNDFDFSRVKNNGETIVQIVTNIFTKYGFVKDNSLQKIKGIVIYPSDYLCPIDPVTKKINITSNTVALHKYDASWQGTFAHLKSSIKRILNL